MSKVKDFFESIKKDKKKGAFLFIFLFLIIVVVVLTLTMDNTSTENQQANNVDGVLVPVDEDKIKNEDYNGRNVNEQNDFFTPAGQTITPEYFDQPQESTPTISPVVKTPQRTGYSTSPSTQRAVSNQPTSQPAQVTNPTPVAVVNQPNKRVRTPNDNFGTFNQGAAVSTKNLWGAVIDNNNSIIRSGSNVVIRLTEEIAVGDKVVPRNSIISGKAQLNQFRMLITITSIKIGSLFLSVNWVIHDEDGVEGLRLPDKLVDELSRDVADGALQQTQVESNVPVVGRVKVGVQTKNREVSFVAQTGHKIYIKQKQ
jgi:hypothetical protein